MREARALAAGIDAASQDARTRHLCSDGGLNMPVQSCGHVFSHEVWCMWPIGLMGRAAG